MMKPYIFCLTTCVCITLPGMCSALIYRVPVTPEWIEFWKVERKPSRINMLSTCPWRYRFNASKTDCGQYYAELHPLARQNCLDLDQSSLSKRVHSTGQCVTLRSHCECDKVIGYTCVYPVDIPAGNMPAGKRNSEDKDHTCNTTRSTDESTEGKNDKSDLVDEKETENMSETKCDKDNNMDPGKKRSTVSMAKPYTTESEKQVTKNPQNDVLVPPFLNPNSQQGSIPSFLRRNNYQLGPPSFLQGLNPQVGIPPLLRPSQFNIDSQFNMNDRNTELNPKGMTKEPEYDEDYENEN